jgi:hypothetical protein
VSSTIGLAQPMPVVIATQPHRTAFSDGV